LLPNTLLESVKKSGVKRPEREIELERISGRASQSVSSSGVRHTKPCKLRDL
jgi:hypothetical protein